MKKLILFSFLLIGCSNYQDKNILEKLTDDELISSVETSDSTLLLFHSKLSNYRQSILDNDIERIKYSDVKYSDIMSYFFTNYEDSIFHDKVEDYFKNNKDAYYRNEYNRVESHIEEVFQNNLKLQKDKFDFQYRGLDSSNRLVFLLKTKSQRNLMRFRFMTVVNGLLIESSTGPEFPDDAPQIIKSAWSYDSYLGGNNIPEYYTYSQKQKIKNELRKLKTSDFTIYYDMDNLKIDGEAYLKTNFEGILSPNYAFEIINSERIDSLTYDKPFIYRLLADDELNYEIPLEYKLKDKFRYQLLDSISNFKKISELFEKMQFVSDYERYLNRKYTRENN